MTTRLLITDSEGKPLHAAEHVSAGAGARWLAHMLAQHHAEGQAVMAFEVHPAQGGSSCQRFMQQVGRYRINLHTRPDGLREVAGLGWRLADRAGPRPLQAPVVAGLCLLHAPADVHGVRYSVRVPRGRHAAAAPDIDTLRQARRFARAQSRATP